MTFLLIVLGISAVYLYVDFRTDPGEHLKAKIIHTILTLYLIYAYLGSINQLIQILQQISSYFQTTPDVGIFSGPVYAAFSIISRLLSIILLWNLGKMIKRDNGARKWVIKLLPILGLFSVVTFYSASFADEGFVGLADWEILLMGFIFMMTFFLGAMFIYRAPFMVRFFERVSADAPLNELVDQIGDDEGGE